MFKLKSKKFASKAPEYDEVTDVSESVSDSNNSDKKVFVPLGLPKEGIENFKKEVSAGSPSETKEDTKKENKIFGQHPTVMNPTETSEQTDSEEVKPFQQSEELQDIHPVEEQPVEDQPVEEQLVENNAVDMDPFAYENSQIVDEAGDAVLAFGGVEEIEEIGEYDPQQGSFRISDSQAESDAFPAAHSESDAFSAIHSEPDAFQAAHSESDVFSAFHSEPDAFPAAPSESDVFPSKHSEPHPFPDAHSDLDAFPVCGEREPHVEDIDEGIEVKSISKNDEIQEIPKDNVLFDGHEGDEDAQVVDEGVDDVLTFEGVEEIEDIRENNSSKGLFQTPPPHLMPSPFPVSFEPDEEPLEEATVPVKLEDMQTSSMHQDDVEEPVDTDNLDEEEVHMDEGLFRQGLRQVDKEGSQPTQLPQMDSPGPDDDDDDDEDDGQITQLEGSYDPADYEHLAVSPEMKELFTFISKYTPQNIELEHQLRPYIPDYIPAVGDIDAFIKIPRPDNEPSTAGLTVLDEPSARQSDATVLDLQLRAVAKHTTARTVVVKTVENAERNTKVIDKWMKDISDLHRAKPPPTVHYAKRMPDIDSLMQEWPGDVEELLKEVNLPSAALEVELPHYVDIICSILDIPVYKSHIQSLHVLFTLFSVFKNSANFRHLAEENAMENEDSSVGPDHVVF